MVSNRDQQKIPIQPVDEPILCSPYEEPTAHWVYDPNTGRPSRQEGRRVAGYWVEEYGTTNEQLALNFAREEGWSTLPIVEKLRDDVKRWRESGYRNATNVTRQLLQYWQREGRQRPLFFCQLEAVETVIYIAEIRRAKHRLGFKPKFEDEDLEQLRDDELIRYGCKMATGSGKTVVMAMLIAWAFCNRGKVRADTRFPSVVLAVCPNLIIKERLQVLRPDSDGNYYDKFNLVPPTLKAFLRRGKVKITNWHQLDLASGNTENGTSHKVIDKGEETVEAYTERVLDELAGRGEIMVLNDEGHHAYRPLEFEAKLNREELEEQETATVWIQGLDRIQKSCGIRFVVDLSATPFYLQGSGHPEGKPFEWIVSDFGLGDAIESGITKIPRIPISDSTGRPEPKYFRLWEHITDALDSKPSPEDIYAEANDALITLASQWKTQFDANGNSDIPNCMIVVCPETRVAEEFHHRISGETGMNGEITYGNSDLFPELQNSESDVNTFRIDSRRLLEEGSDAERLRKIVDTIGKEGQPGEQIRCVVSVSMLNEGWDANNVTQIIGLRAFKSQLLCEQVVGRGLRRMSYDIDPKTGLLPPEYVDIYGIPFTLIPFKGRQRRQQRPDKPTYRVRALPARREYEIQFPNVEGYTFELRHDAITANIGEMEELKLELSDTPDELFAGGITLSEGRHVYIGERQIHDRQAFYESNHFQTIKFDIVRQILARLPIDQWERKPVLSREQLFPQIYRLIDTYMLQKFKPGYVDPRELGNVKYKNQVVNLFLDAIQPNTEAGEAPLLPIINPNKPLGSSKDVDFSTTKDCYPTEKSHVNFVAVDSTWEASAAFRLERSTRVKNYVRNDGLWFTIPYHFAGASRDYVPDFIVDMTGGTRLIVEIKGKETMQDQAKYQAARRWVQAVNHSQKFGTWDFLVCRNPRILAYELDRYE
ncbi:hypothetical protein C6499_11270 [Candidatus Poribacteria bacterium]|nr:MAG: hypothetical protein C6499_11270 [Candidatus Poribacteria bacterium]